MKTPLLIDFIIITNNSRKIYQISKKLFFNKFLILKWFCSVNLIETRLFGVEHYFFLDCYKLYKRAKNKKTVQQKMLDSLVF